MLFHQCDNIVVTFPKCDTKDTLCDDSDDAFAIVHKKLGMSVKRVCMTRGIHQHQIYPLKQAKTPLYTISDTSHSKRRRFIYKEKIGNDNERNTFQSEYNMKTTLIKVKESKSDG